MDKAEKLALARKKLRKFQAKSSSTVHTYDTTTTKTIPIAPVPLQTESHPPPITKLIKLSTPELTTINSTINNDVHSQTIDILISEKTDLIVQLSASKTYCHTKQVECTNLQEEVQSLRREMERLQRERDKLALTLSEKTKLLTMHASTDTNLRASLHQSQIKLEELEQEKSELLSKINQQRHESFSFQTKQGELERDVNMYKLLSQQLQLSPRSSYDNNDQKKIEALQGDLAIVSASVQSMKRERDQALSDVTALRETMMQNRQESAREVGDLQTQLKESQIHLSSLHQQLASQHHHDTSQNEINEECIRAKDHALLISKKEITSLHVQVQQLTTNNQMLSQMLSETEDRAANFEQQLKLARDQVVDQQTLLSTVSHDKEMLSRVVAQNKELKKNLGELQDAFILRSNQNAELADSQETELRRRQKLQEKCHSLQESLNTETQRLLELTEEVNLLRRSSQLQDVPVAEPARDQQELCTSLREERDRLLEELRHISPPPMEQDDVVQTVDIQQSFSALQEHFVTVMQDKAELEDRLHESEHQIIQLEGETETIGEYITLYQTQREALGMKSKEKDHLIQQLLEDKALLELRLREVQGLVNQLDHHEDKMSVSLPSHLQTPHQEQIVSMIQELTSPITGLERSVHCPCCSGNLIVL